MANVTAVSQSVPQAVFCEKCVCWCRNEREYGTHVDGQRHRAPALTREVLFGLLFGNVGVDGSSDQLGAWYTSIDAFLSHRRLKARQAAPGHAKKRKTPASADPVLVLLFYKYTDPAISRDNVERLHQWQSKLGRSLSMTGRGVGGSTRRKAQQGSRAREPPPCLPRGAGMAGQCNVRLKPKGQNATAKWTPKRM